MPSLEYIFDSLSFVNPFIGTDSDGHVFLGASVPFGAIQIGPSSPDQRWKWASGYHFSDTKLIGFSHTHLSGGGIPDLGDFLVSPFEENVSFSNQKCSPGFYSVLLSDVAVQLTSSKRVAFHKYSFPKAGQLFVNLAKDNGDKTHRFSIETKNSSTFFGFRYSYGWIQNHVLYFAAVTKPDFSHFLNFLEGGIFSFSEKAVLLKVGISALSS